MAASEFELHPDRLSTTDEKGKRLFVYPADVQGSFRTRRMKLQAFLIGFFLILPWVRINGRQAFLLDIPDRKFEIFGLSLRAHNAPLLIFIFAIAAFSLFFATAVFGRIWCGWACPQTVFIDAVFRRIERWVEGPATARKNLARSQLSAQKLYKLSVKWGLYIVASLIITHSFLAYFVGTEKLAHMITRPPSESWGHFIFMLVSSVVILFDFAWFREQFCIILCPYGRFQSVLMDKSSLIVAYDPVRGEPRSTPSQKALAKVDGSRLGDCVNCYRCVQVCPTGIDIRRGLQMECIACTSCIDACNEVMTKIKKPTGLIRYDSLDKKIKSGLNLRASLYLAFALFSVGALAISLYMIKPVDAEILRAKDDPYTLQAQGENTVFVLNHFKIELSNESGAKHELSFKSGEASVQIITALQTVLIRDGQVMQIDVFFRFKKENLTNGEKLIKLIINDKNQSTNQILKIEKEVRLVGPYS